MDATSLVLVLLLAFPSSLSAQPPSLSFPFGPNSSGFRHSPAPQRPDSTPSSSPWPSTSPSPDGSISPINAPVQSPSMPPSPGPPECEAGSTCREISYHSRNPPPPSPWLQKSADDGGDRKKKELNPAEKVGLAFLAAAVALQIFFAGFLFYKRRRMRNAFTGRGLERDPPGDSSPLASSFSTPA